MNIHPLRDLEAAEQRAIEELIAEYDDTHRTFKHLIGELEELEALTRELENPTFDSNKRAQLIKERNGRALVRRLDATLARLVHDEEALLRTSNEVRHKVAADILAALNRFSKTA